MPIAILSLTLSCGRVVPEESSAARPLPADNETAWIEGAEATSLLATAAPGETANPAAPDEFASLVLEDPHGRRVELSPYRGKVRVFDIWATWCGPCRRIIPQLNRLYERHRKNGLVVVGLSVDDYPVMVLEFQRKIPLNYPNGMFNSQAAELLGAPSAVPTTFLVDRQGRIRRKFVGLINESALEKAIRELL